MKIHFIFISVFLWSSFTVLVGANRVLCYQCTYIGGVPDFSSNSDCVDNLDSSHPSTSIYIKEGVACMKAEGTVRGQYFVIRRALRPDLENDLPLIPFGESSLSCSGFGENGILGQISNGQVAHMARAIGDTDINALTSCLICNDRDECNGASTIKLRLGFILLSTLVVCLIQFLEF